LPHTAFCRFLLLDGFDSLGRPRCADAWLNVNRTPDSNFMHTHQVDLWSAVYYVSEGEPNAPGSAHPTCGHMIFRGGPRPVEEGGPRLGNDGQPRQSYFAVPPAPGTLWLFPGSVPHTVMHTVLPEGVPEPFMPRISIGVNFDSAIAPIARRWTCAASWDDQIAAAALRAARLASEGRLLDHRYTVAAEAAPTTGTSPAVHMSHGAEDNGQSVAVADESTAVVAVQGVVDRADASEARARAAREAEDSPFLMLTPEEAKERGFEDDELIMPLPVDSSDSDSN